MVLHWDRRFQYCVMVEALWSIGDIYRVPQTSYCCGNLLVLICVVLRSEWMFRYICICIYKHLESFEVWCWRRMEKMTWTDHVRNEEILLRDKEQRNILHEISKRKANWIGHILRRNCLLQRVIEWKIKGGREVTGGQGRRRKKLLDDLKDRRGYSHLKEEFLNGTKWRGRFWRGIGPVVRQTTKWMKRWLVRKAEDLPPSKCRTSRKSGSLTYPEPLGPLGPVVGDLYFF